MDGRAAVAREEAPCRVAAGKPKRMIDRPQWLRIARTRLAQMPRHLALAGTREGRTRRAPMNMREPGVLKYPVVIINWVQYLGPPGPSPSQILGTFSRFSEDFLGRERERGGSLGDPPGP